MITKFLLIVTPGEQFMHYTIFLYPIASDEMAAPSSSAEAASNYTQPEFLMTSPLVTTIVRRELAVAIRDLMQHGMLSVIIDFAFTKVM